jgi:hypothetical protein
VHKILSVLAISALAAAPAVGSDKQDVMAVVQQWADAFNKDDSNAQVATCAAETSIIDDFAPHEWHGAGACAKWKDALDVFAKKHEVTGMTLGVLKPRHVDVAADSAYVVVSMTFSFQHNGKDVKDAGTFTGALHRGTSGWRITGWAWAAH